MGLALIARIRAGRFKQNGHALVNSASQSAHTWRRMMDVEVTQAAREAAREWMATAIRDGVIRKGSERDYPLARAFARLEQSTRIATERKVWTEAAEVARKQAQVFLSPEYTFDQPLASFGERFACEQLALAFEQRANAD